MGIPRMEFHSGNSIPGISFREFHSENFIPSHSDEGGILAVPLRDLLAQDWILYFIVVP